MKNESKKKRNYVPEKLRALLQKEINSECPFCESQEVGHFEAHHIDENRENTVIENLLMVCRTCHSKITKKDISQSQVILRKAELQAGIKSKIELVSINVDSENCSWVAHKEIDNCFFDKESPKSPHPILDFSFINHTNKTIILKAIQVKIENLPSGLMGLPLPPMILKSVCKYSILIDKLITLYRVPDPIQVFSQQGFRFQAELIKKGFKDNEAISFEGRVALYISFEFNDKVTVNAPTIYLNCTGEGEGFILSYLE